MGLFYILLGVELIIVLGCSVFFFNEWSCGFFKLSSCFVSFIKNIIIVNVIVFICLVAVFLIFKGLFIIRGTL